MNDKEERMSGLMECALDISVRTTNNLNTCYDVFFAYILISTG